MTQLSKTEVKVPDGFWISTVDCHTDCLRSWEDLSSEDGWIVGAYAGSVWKTLGDRLAGPVIVAFRPAPVEG